MKVLRIEMK